jgi:hypothetical protein
MGDGEAYPLTMGAPARSISNPSADDGENVNGANVMNGKEKARTGLAMFKFGMPRRSGPRGLSVIGGLGQCEGKTKNPALNERISIRALK